MPRVYETTPHGAGREKEGKEMVRAIRPPQTGVNRQHTAPVSWKRSTRPHDVEIGTSCMPGKFVPVGVFPMLRGDSMSGTLNVSCEMLETYEIIANRVWMRVRAVCVPWLAMARFEGSRDQFERSYNGQPKVDGGAVVPFFETAAFGTHGANAVYKALGLHGESADQVNTMYLEGYNLAWNYLAKNRSMDLTARARLADTLAPAFWVKGRFGEVVPDFDDGAMDGEVALAMSGQLAVKGKAPVTGLYFDTGGTTNALAGSGSFGVTTGTNSIDPITGMASKSASGTANSTAYNLANSNVWADAGLSVSTLYADLADFISGEGGTISLANIEVARKAQRWAKVRAKYEGLTDEYMIEMLMDGLQLPDQWASQPFEVFDAVTQFVQAKRYATDSANLAASAVSGGASINVPVNVPQLDMGGMVFLFVEISPSQLFERQQDPFFVTNTPNTLPHALRDDMDPQKVDVILNKQVDSKHSAPSTIFGYAPKHWQWRAWGPRMGGKFLRPTTDPSSDTGARRRLWASEASNPVLGTDFYLTTTVHTKPFLDGVNDPFEIGVAGQLRIRGLTQFGPPLLEGTDNYNEIMEDVDFDRVVPAE